MVASFVANVPATNALTGTTIGFTVPATSPGQSILLALAFDNTTTTAPTVSSITRMAGETASWTLVSSWNAVTATAAAGIRGELWRINTTVAWSAGTYTATLSASVGLKVGMGYVLQGLGAVSGTALSASSATSASIAGGITVPAGGIGIVFSAVENSAIPPWTGTQATTTTNQLSTATTGGNAQTNIGARTGLTTAAPTAMASGAGFDSGILAVAFVGGPVTFQGSGTVAITSTVQGQSFNAARAVAVYTDDPDGWTGFGTQNGNVCYKDLTIPGLQPGDQVFAFGLGELYTQSAGARGIAVLSGPLSAFNADTTSLATLNTDAESVLLEASATGTGTAVVRVSLPIGPTQHMGVGAWVIPAAFYASTAYIVGTTNSATGTSTLSKPASGTMLFVGADRAAVDVTNVSPTPFGGTVRAQKTVPGVWSVYVADWPDQGPPPVTATYGPAGISTADYKTDLALIFGPKIAASGTVAITSTVTRKQSEYIGYQTSSTVSPTQTFTVNVQSATDVVALFLATEGDANPRALLGATFDGTATAALQTQTAAVAAGTLQGSIFAVYGYAPGAYQFVATFDGNVIGAVLAVYVIHDQVRIKFQSAETFSGNGVGGALSGGLPNTVLQALRASIYVQAFATNVSTYTVTGDYTRNFSDNTTSLGTVGISRETSFAPETLTWSVDLSPGATGWVRINGIFAVDALPLQVSGVVAITPFISGAVIVLVAKQVSGSVAIISNVRNPAPVSGIVTVTSFTRELSKFPGTYIDDPNGWTGVGIQNGNVCYLNLTIPGLNTGDVLWVFAMGELYTQSAGTRLAEVISGPVAGLLPLSLASVLNADTEWYGVQTQAVGSGTAVMRISLRVGPTQLMGIGAYVIPKASYGLMGYSIGVGDPTASANIILNHSGIVMMAQADRLAVDITTAPLASADGVSRVQKTVPGRWSVHVGDWTDRISGSTSVGLAGITGADYSSVINKLNYPPLVSSGVVPISSTIAGDATRIAGGGGPITYPASGSVVVTSATSGTVRSVRTASGSVVNTTVVSGNITLRGMATPDVVDLISSVLGIIKRIPATAPPLIQFIGASLSNNVEDSTRSTWPVTAYSDAAPTDVIVFAVTGESAVLTNVLPQYAYFGTHELELFSFAYNETSNPTVFTAIYAYQGPWDPPSTDEEVFKITLTGETKRCVLAIWVAHGGTLGHPNDVMGDEVYFESASGSSSSATFTNVGAGDAVFVAHVTGDPVTGFAATGFTEDYEITSADSGFTGGHRNPTGPAGPLTVRVDHPASAKPVVMAAWSFTVLIVPQDVSGTVPNTSTISGTVRSVRTASGSVAVTSALSGAAKLQGIASGAVTTITTSVGAAKLQGVVAGTVAIIPTLAGSVTEVSPASGAVTTITTSVGATKLQGVATGTATAVTTAVGSVTLVTPAAGVVAVVSASSGSTGFRGVTAGTVAVIPTFAGSVTLVTPASGAVAVTSAVAGSAIVTSGAIAVVPIGPLVPVSGTDYQTASVSSGTSIILLKPTGVINGDVLFLFVQDHVFGTTTPAPGWTLLWTLPNRGGGLYSKVIPNAAAETATSYTWSFPGANGRLVGIVWRLSGVNNTTPVDVLGTELAGAAGTVSLPSVTTVTPNALLMVPVFANPGSNNQDAVFTFPASAPEMMRSSAAIPTAASVIAVGYEMRTTEGATGTRTVSGVGTPVGGAATPTGILLAIRPSLVIYQGSGTTPITSTLSGSAALQGVASGAVSAVSTVSGSVTTVTPASGVVAIIPTLAGSLALRGVTVGTAVTVASTAVGSVTAVTPAAGSVAITSASTGSPAFRAVTSGVVVAASTVSGAVTLIVGAVTYPVSGTVSPVITVLGTVTEVFPVFGTVAAISASVGVPALRAVVTGVVAIIPTLAGSVTLVTPASGVVTGVSTQSGAAVFRGVTVGTTVAVASAVAGSVTAITPAAGSADITTVLAGATVFQGVTSGAVAAVTTASGSVVLTLRLAASGTVVAISTVASSETARLVATGTTAILSAVFGNVTESLVVSGTVVAVSTSAGDAPKRTQLSGSTAISSATSGTVTTLFAAAGIVPILTVLAGDAPKQTPTTGSVAAVTTASGAITTLLPTAGSVAIVSDSTGALTKVGPLTSVVAIISDLAGDAPKISVASGIVGVLSTAQGVVTKLGPAAAVVVVQSTVLGDLWKQTPVIGSVPVLTALAGDAPKISVVSASVPILSISSGSPRAIFVAQSTVAVLSQTSGVVAGGSGTQGVAAIQTTVSSSALRAFFVASAQVPVQTVVTGDVSTRRTASAIVAAVSDTSGALSKVGPVTSAVSIVSVPSGAAQAIFVSAGITDLLTTLVGAVLGSNATGTVTVLATVTGSATKTSQASGSVDVLSTAAGAARATFVAGGVIPVVTVVSAGTATTRQGAGTVVVTSTVQGDVTPQLAVSGATAAVSTVQGAATLLTPVSGFVAILSTAQGTVAMRAPAVGTVAILATATGDFTKRTASAGTVAVVSDTAGALTQRALIAGTVAVISASAGDLNNTSLPVVGMTLVLSSQQGAVSKITQASGVVEILSTSTGSLTAARFTVAGSVAGVSDVLGAVTQISVVRAQTDIITVVSGDVLLQQVLTEGTVEITAVITGAVSLLGQISGEQAIVSDATGILLALYAAISLKIAGQLVEMTRETLRLKHNGTETPVGLSLKVDGEELIFWNP